MSFVWCQIISVSKKKCSRVYFWLLETGSILLYHSLYVFCESPMKHFYVDSDEKIGAKEVNLCVVFGLGKD